MHDLPKPEVLRCSFDDGFPARMATMTLSWPQVEGVADSRTWHWPRNVQFASPLPETFGILLLRLEADSYCLVLLWEQFCLRWSSLTRAELLLSSLPIFLEALATDIYYLLDQPIIADSDPLLRAA
jgi:hypothetical protein